MNHHTKVIFQRGRDVLDFELNELQDCLRIFAARAAAMLGDGALSANDLKCSGDNATANLAINATTAKGYLVDGTPIRLEANTTLAIPATAGTYKVYAVISQAEISDPAAVAELGSTTKRNRYSISFAHTLGAIPSDTVQELWEGGTRYRYLADVVRTGATPILTAQVTDKRNLLPAYFVSTAMQSSGTPKQTITGDLQVTGVLTPGSLSLTDVVIGGNLTVLGNVLESLNMVSTKALRWSANTVEIYSSAVNELAMAFFGNGQIDYKVQLTGPDFTRQRFTSPAGSMSGDVMVQDALGMAIGTVTGHDTILKTNDTSRWAVKASTGDLEAQGGNRKIRNVDDPVLDQDAVTLTHLNSALKTHNAVINSAFDFWQRKTSSGAVFASASAGVYSREYVADRWTIGVADGAASSSTESSMVRATAGSGVSNANYECQIGGSAGPGSAGGYTVRLTQEIDRKLVRDLRGKTINLSAYLRNISLPAGVDYTLSLYSGTGVETQIYGAYSNVVATLTANVNALGTSFVRRSCTGSVGSNVTCLAIVLEFNPDSSGAEDGAMAITQVQLAEVVDGTVVPAWRRCHDSIADELDACEYYYQKTYAVDTDPGSSTSLGVVRTWHDTVADADTSFWRLGQHISFRRRMRATPSVVVYATGFSSPANGKIFFESVPSDRATGVSNVSETGASLTNATGASYAPVSVSQVAFHWTASAEI